MNKQEALKHIKEQVGFVPHAAILDIYNDEEEIPEELIELQCNFLKEPPKPLIIYTSLKGIKAFEDAFKEYEK